MLPNRFVIIWDNFPVGIHPYTERPFKTPEPSKVKYFTERFYAERYLEWEQGHSQIGPNAFVKEIQFRIVG